MENFWSLLKRGLHGTYISVEPYHLFRYIDEQAFRYNTRKEMNDSERFALAVSQITGKRLTYAELTGQTGGSQTTTRSGSRVGRRVALSGGFDLPLRPALAWVQIGLFLVFGFAP
jgi:hypothetical protein